MFPQQDLLPHQYLLPLRMMMKIQTGSRTDPPDQEADYGSNIPLAGGVLVLPIIVPITTDTMNDRHRSSLQLPLAPQPRGWAGDLGEDGGGGQQPPLGAVPRLPRLGGHRRSGSDDLQVGFISVIISNHCLPINFYFLNNIIPIPLQKIPIIPSCKVFSPLSPSKKHSPKSCKTNEYPSLCIRMTTTCTCGHVKVCGESEV